LRRLHECRLYGILDLGYVESSAVLRVAGALIEGGVDLIQLRGKAQSLTELKGIAASLHELTFAAGIPLIINDHAEIARDVPVQGVHVGQDDRSIEAVRVVVGREILVGKSTHSPAQAAAAQTEGADYIGFGPLFATPTKPDYPAIGLGDIGQVHQDVEVPIFCIGGIKLENLEQVIAAGAQRVVIVSGLLIAPNVIGYARSAKELLKKITPQPSNI
jgi:thiamine-phosphate pyrophosphorylase